MKIDMSKRDFITDLRELISKYKDLKIAFEEKNESSTRTTVRLDIQEVDSKGEIKVSDFEHSLCDAYCKRNGVVFDYDHKHIIGSKWVSPGTSPIYVVGFRRRNRKYPILIQYEGYKKIYKVGASYLKSCSCSEMTVSLEDFKVWLTMDPEEDCISREDEETYDKVEEILKRKYSEKAWKIIDERHKDLLRLYTEHTPEGAVVRALHAEFSSGAYTLLLNLMNQEINHYGS